MVKMVTCVLSGMVKMVTCVLSGMVKVGICVNIEDLPSVVFLVLKYHVVFCICLFGGTWYELSLQCKNCIKTSNFKIGDNKEL